MPQIPKLSVFVGQKSLVCVYYIQIVRDGIHIQVYKINKASVTYFIQFISEKVKKIERKHQAQFREGLGKWKFMQNDCFLFKQMYIAL